MYCRSFRGFVLTSVWNSAGINFYRAAAVPSVSVCSSYYCFLCVFFRYKVPHDASLLETFCSLVEMSFQCHCTPEKASRVISQHDLAWFRFDKLLSGLLRQTLSWFEVLFRHSRSTKMLLFLDMWASCHASAARHRNTNTFQDICVCFSSAGEICHHK